MFEQGYHKIFTTASASFEALALDIYHYQLNNNAVYRDFVNALGGGRENPRSLEDIPFMPIRFFKSHTVSTGTFEPETIFESSGTTGMVNSRHLVRDVFLYERSFLLGFNRFYGNPADYCILGLLPSYLERGNSSLVYMVDRLIRESGHPDSGFYLHNYAALAEKLQLQEKAGQRVLLIGVTYALLDFAEQFPMPLRHTIIMETGGMKGRRKELIRPEVHTVLKQAFGLQSIHSEYGMTELLAQAYSPGEGVFHCPSWMKIMVRDDEDPLTVNRSGSGAINVIDLSNIHSCSFIATDDAGKVYADGSFEILGRIDGSDLRGCSLLVYQQA